MAATPRAKVLRCKFKDQKRWVDLRGSGWSLKYFSEDAQEKLKRGEIYEEQLGVGLESSIRQFKYG